MDRHLTPYEKGQAEAWLSPVTRNPYDRDSDGEREWLMGWQDAKDKRIAELEAALRPFSVFHAALVKLLGGASPKNADFYTIQAGVEAAVTLRIEDFAAAAKAVQK